MPDLPEFESTDELARHEMNELDRDHDFGDEDTEDFSEEDDDD